MTTRVRSLWLVSACCLAFVAVGCGHDDYRADTELRSDGSVKRAILQPTAHLPESARDASRWTKLFRVDHDKNRPLDAPIRELKPTDAGGNVDAPLVAWGEFRAASDIPEHIRWETPDKTGVGKLERATERRDLVFVTEHVWSETLTDIVTLDDFHAARTELTDLVIRVLDDTLREELGPDVDLSRLIEWLRDDASRFVERVADLFLWRRHAGSKRSDDDFQRDVSAECRRFGFEPEGETELERFCAARLRATVRLRSGEPLDDETIGAIIDWIFHRNTLGEQPAKQADRFEAAAKRVIERRYGGEEIFQRRVGSLFARLVGVYGLFAAREHFRYTLKMPGLIVETNGALVDDDLALWTFTAADAFPSGYEMRARSLELNSAALKAVGIDDARWRPRRNLYELALALEKNSSLGDTLRECVAKKSLTPLETRRAEIERDANPDRKAAARQLARLLGLK